MLKIRWAALVAPLLLASSLALIAPAAAQQKTTIGVSLAQDDNPFYIAMLRGIRARAQRCSLLQLNARTCRWPVGDPARAGFFFCAVPRRCRAGLTAPRIAPAPIRSSECRMMSSE